jgi:hypothetical protein
VGARDILLTEGGVIEAATTREGPGGVIAIQTETLRLTGQAQIDSSSRSGSNGTGGHVSVVAREVELTDEGRIVAQTSGAGPGGEIAIETGTLRLSGQARINGNSSGKGQGEYYGTGGERVEMVGQARVASPRLTVVPLRREMRGRSSSLRPLCPWSMAASGRELEREVLAAAVSSSAGDTILQRTERH